MQQDKDLPGISCGLVDNNVFEWEVMLMMNDECKYYGGKESVYIDDTTANKDPQEDFSVLDCRSRPNIL